MDRNYHAAAAVGLVVLLSSCAATPVPQPFQARGNTLAGYGYSEVETDSLHYSVSYSDTSPKTTNFYYAWGQVALLTDDQARANNAALAVAQVLARPAP
jgi:hypothetical protein